MKIKDKLFNGHFNRNLNDEIYEGGRTIKKGKKSG